MPPTHLCTPTRHLITTLMYFYQTNTSFLTPDIHIMICISNILSAPNISNGNRLKIKQESWFLYLFFSITDAQLKLSKVQLGDPNYQPLGSLLLGQELLTKLSKHSCIILCYIKD